MIDANNDRQILMDHYTKPKNFKPLNLNEGYSQNLKSNSCADNITIQIFGDNQKIDEILFEGSACVIATSTTDILIDLLKGKTFNEVNQILDDYENMIVNGVPASKKIGDLQIFANIHHQKNRQICALLSTKGIRDYLKTIA